MRTLNPRSSQEGASLTLQEKRTLLATLVERARLAQQAGSATGVRAWRGRARQAMREVPLPGRVGGSADYG